MLEAGTPAAPTTGKNVVPLFLLADTEPAHTECLRAQFTTGCWGVCSRKRSLPGVKGCPSGLTAQAGSKDGCVCPCPLEWGCLRASCPAPGHLLENGCPWMSARVAYGTESSTSVRTPILPPADSACPLCSSFPTPIKWVQNSTCFLRFWWEVKEFLHV